ncbi:MAG: hypothetical protein K0Q76_4128 [Panacagrimonas sp.]|jgi:hypothetical protein|nr:DUF4286 family protein [Panacagrimonas sp.]MCC2659020.1 hypothetical protein [Panacagrimonas sp.]
MVRSIFLVLSDATGPDTDAEFNRWYSEKHIQDVAKVPGVVSATRYRIEKGVTVLPGVNADRHGFVAIYEIEAKTKEELEMFAASLRTAIDSGAVDISPTLDFKGVTGSLCVPITARVTAK